VSRAYVVCRFCGARIRADRGRCLRCGEVLEAAQVVEGPPTLQEWLQTVNLRNVALGAVAVIGVLVAAALFFDPRPTPVTNARAVPAAARPAAAPVAPRTIQPDGLLAPATVADSVRFGSAAFSSGDFTAARIRYQQALLKKPDDAEALNGLGLVMEREGQVQDAIAQFTRAATVSPNNWAYRFNLAHALGETGDWGRAIDEYRAAATLFPDDYATQYNLALALHKKGDDEGAIPEYRKAIAMAPGEPSFHLSLGTSLEKTGKIGDAQREYQQYLDMNPAAPEAEKLRAHLKTMGTVPGV
jgi:Flp pilus assembly protein TadD